MAQFENSRVAQRLYDLDSYAAQMDGAEVLGCEPAKNGFFIELDRTCFFPEGGGQPGDTGVLTGPDGKQAAVNDTKLRNGRVVHVCSAAFETGDRVHGTLNFERRFRHMQAHCGEHILSGILLREYGLKNVGFHMGEGYCTIDLDGMLSDERKNQAELLVNRAIYKNAPVRVWYPTQEELDTLPLRKRPAVNEPLRVVEIQGYDMCGCCGTHVAYTGEIGLLKITDAARYKGGTRLTFLCGEDALRHYQQTYDRMRALAVGFSCKPETVPAQVEKLRQEVSAARAQAADKTRLLFARLEPELAAGAVRHGEAEVLICRESSFSGEDCRELALLLTKKAGRAAVVCGGQETGRYAIARHPDTALDLKALDRTLCTAFEGKGGGSAVLCQGSIKPMAREELETAVRACFLSLSV